MIVSDARTQTTSVIEPVAGPPRRPGGSAIARGPRPTRTIIVPTSGWRMIDIGELWRARELVAFFVLRDVKVRYKQTVLGAGWAIIQPFLMMIVFSVFFGRISGVSSGGVPYPLFVYAGLLPWTFFAATVAGAGNSVVGSERLVTKVYFPRLAIPFSVAGWAALDLAIASILLGVMMAWYRLVPGVGLLLLPVWFCLIGLAALGIGTGLAALNVAYRDFRYVIPFLVQLGMFATPTVYMQPVEHASPTALAMGGDIFRKVLDLNPMTPLIAAFRSSVLGTTPPTSGALAWATLTAPALFIVGCLYFRKVEGDFADVV